MSDLFVGIIGGSGLGEVLAAESGDVREIHTPFGAPSSPIVVADWGGKFGGTPIAILQRHGPEHHLNPSQVPYRANIYALKKLGVTHVIASGATGSLQDGIAPGDLVMVDQLIDRTRHRAGTFYERAAVHVEFAEPFCPVMRKWLLATGEAMPDVKIHPQGTYVCMEGPAFSTRAESHVHRLIGGDLIGMTACPEAKLAREAEMAYAMIAMPTDYDCWRPHDNPGAATEPQQLLQQIISNLNAATERNIELIRTALADVSMLREQPSPAHSALDLAIWTDKSKIDPAEIERLSVLWGRHFS